MDLPVLRLVGGVVVVDGRLLLDDLTLGAGAGHGGAEEAVDEQHDAEQDPESDAEPHQPVGVAGAPADAGAVDGGSWGNNTNLFITIFLRRAIPGLFFIYFRLFKYLR